MCKTRHIHKTISKERICAFLGTLSQAELKKLKPRLMRLMRRGGLTLVLTPELTAGLTAYDLNSYRRK